MTTKVLNFEGEIYYFVKPLGGRGQKLVAGTGIYEKTNKGTGVVDRFIVKFDPPGTCLGECMVVNPAGSNAINAAKLGIESSSQRPFSIQSFVKPNPRENFRAFDVLALGQARRPKRAISDEYTYRDNIKDSLNRMTPDAKKQFAQGIYLSQLNGDESLHTGQFVCSVNKDDQITKITRIDLGAIGRYAVDRDGRQDYQIFQTSSSYQKSGQFKKDYVGAYVGREAGNPAIKAELYKLWMDTDVDLVCDNTSNKFQEQMSKFESNPNLQYQALFQFNKTLLKGTRADKGMDPEQFATLTPAAKTEELMRFTAEVRSTLELTTRSRCNAMKAVASNEYQEHMDYAVTKIEKFAKKDPVTDKKQSLNMAFESTKNMEDPIKKAEFIVRLDETYDQVLDSLPLSEQQAVKNTLNGIIRDQSRSIEGKLEQLDDIQSQLSIEKQHTKAVQYLDSVRAMPLEKRTVLTPAFAGAQIQDTSMAGKGKEIWNANYLKKLSKLYDLIYSDDLPSSLEKQMMKEQLTEIIMRSDAEALNDLDDLEAFYNSVMQPPLSEASTQVYLDELKLRIQTAFKISPSEGTGDRLETKSPKLPDRVGAIYEILNQKTSSLEKYKAIKLEVDDIKPKLTRSKATSELYQSIKNHRFISTLQPPIPEFPSMLPLGASASAPLPPKLPSKLPLELSASSPALPKSETPKLPPRSRLQQSAFQQELREVLDKGRKDQLSPEEPEAGDGYKGPG